MHHTNSSRLISVCVAGVIFLAALLLFGMEPLAGRLLVPFFGATVHVWLVCLMFFQAMLLVGYLYAHLFAERIGAWHLLILLLPIANLPLGIEAEPMATVSITGLLQVLLRHVALPFVVLSTTAVVLQSWFARSAVIRNRNPYPLYAASNAGSMLALLGYPLLVEPLAGLKAQSILWSAAYVAYAGLVAVLWFVLRPRQGFGDATAPSAHDEGWNAKHQYAFWILLSSLPSAFLLTVTNFIATEVGSFPMVWVIPLAIYLASFVVTFRSGGGIPKILRIAWPEVALLGMALYLSPSRSWLALAGHLFVLFATCLVAHGELYERRPPTKHLTKFYLAIALGGWLGGCLISLVAPRVFSGLYDYPLTLLAIVALFFVFHGRSFLMFWRKVSLPVAAVRMCVCAVLLVLTGVGAAAALTAKERFRHRNYYGTYRVVDDAPTPASPRGFRQLIHGSTLHGAQLLDENQQHIPVAYFHARGGIAQVYAATHAPRRIAVLGLGAGVVATYTRPSDDLTFFEIDPDNEAIARDWFTYLDGAEATTRVIPGDGRLSLQMDSTAGRPYDILHMDAFTGDGIPTHLLTLEALDCYLSRLTEDGLILFHISNRYYDLRPEIKAAARALDLFGAMNIPTAKNELGPFDKACTCIVLARRPERLEPLKQLGWIELGPSDGLPHVEAWTDDYVNILRPLFSVLLPRAE